MELLPDLLLGLLVILVLGLVVTGVMHLVHRVPYVPTPHRIVREMLTLAELKPGDTVFDLGSGDGRLLIAAKRACPGIMAIGCELVPTVWLLSVLRRMCARADITLHLKDARQEDLREADVVFLYLLPSLLEALMPSFVAQLKPGTRIVSLTFRLPGKIPKAEKKVPRFGRETSIFLYEW